MSRWMVSSLAGLLAACAADHQGEAIQQHYISSGEDLRSTPYAYSNPAPYGYHLPWGQPNAETVGYLSADRFAPRPGLVCERGRHVCYTSNGIDAAETERYLGPRGKWKRDKAYGTPQTYFMMP
ncbi:hypothetical protein SMD31_14380 [Dongia rigui]|uniref:Uncharacterized protein n=2 Tax=Dongia rigui TaxID=940149 RepID=A0ABU5E1P8_9PROT|nr:hypothetical protein [Dongia rigui]